MIKEDIVAKVADKLNDIKAKDIMSTSVISTTREEHLSNVSDLMSKNKISGVPVLEKDGTIIGVVTITDLFLAMGAIKHGTSLEKGKVPCSEPIVETVMTKNIMSVGEDINLGAIIDIMIRNGIHTLPVVKENKMIGVIGRRDVIRNFYSILKTIAC